MNQNNSIQDEITLVTCLYQINTNRHKFSDYLEWIDLLLQINKPIVFYIQPNLSEIIKHKRPQVLQKKTIWIEKEFSIVFMHMYII